MDELNLKQLALAVRTIAEEKNLPEDVVMSPSLTLRKSKKMLSSAI